MKKLEEAIQLRNEGNYAEANALFVQLVEQNPNDAQANYHCAWSFDVMGLEAAAVPYYETAIQLGLEDVDAQGAFLGLGSTYRTLGEYEKSKRVFEEGIERFPDHLGLKTFYAMTLYNLHEHQKAMEILLTCLARTSTDPSIATYKKAIEFYSGQLDKVWK
ncbi:tetratricopeptide repeat protein [Lederbergia citrea]|uniref:tetratricopeptide repeat protein n=1 Tax=Lederbergia citrea TaxID=2833581 RepID=UPI001BC8CD88|nr:tetratricopeptide repeat protein [Lederbergia citrea]MBS4179018.1 tetratricopeptide repeat protein [Lederbergia citrea]